MPLITAEELRSLFSYDPDTGEFTRIKLNGTKRNRWKPGTPVGTLSPDGYIRIWISRHLYVAQRLAFLYVTGRWPHPEVDHWDRNRSNNRWVNLREATYGQNRTNKPVQKNSATGVKGVSQCSRTDKWVAFIQVAKKSVYLGRYDTIPEAAKAYKDAAEKFYGEFART